MSKISEIVCKQTGDKIKYCHHDSGLDIYICEMKGFSTAYALFGTRYGSINTRFKTENDEDFIDVPEGIAHYLEHKLFENEDCGAFEKYAKTGANANAYTSFDRTCYLFSCSDKYRESLKILLDFVQDPYFTKENVDKEQGIIAQEINMMDDTPGWKVFFNLLDCLYHNHPVKIDIAGTVESIAKIDKDLLYRCYYTFYNLNNMALAIAGNVDAEEVLKVADESLKKCEDKKLQVSFPDEPSSVVRDKIEYNMEVGIPLFNIGFKLSPKSGRENLKAEIISNILLQVISDSSSPLYNNLVEKDLVNSSFSSEVFCGNGYFSLIFGGESDDAYTVFEMIKEEIKRLQKEGIDENHFNEVKKYNYGSMIRELNNVEAVASNMISAGLEKLSPFESIDLLSEITFEDVQNFLNEEIDVTKSAVSIVKK